MTLRTKDSTHSLNLNQVFSDLLLLQTASAPTSTDLSSSAPLFSILPPKASKALLEFMLNPGRPADAWQISGFHAQIFANVEEAGRVWPNLMVNRGLPFAIGEFLHSDEEKCLFDFAPYGAVVIFRGEGDLPSKHDLPTQILTPVLNYALGPELWGTQGKWTRFHARLQNVFSNHSLLISAVAGRYVLKVEAKKLIELGFPGDVKQDQFILTMPWTFSLNELQNLEDILEREF